MRIPIPQTLGYCLDHESLVMWSWYWQIVYKEKPLPTDQEGQDRLAQAYFEWLEKQ